jgi:hypothetical protein
MLFQCECAQRTSFEVEGNRRTNPIENKYQGQNSTNENLRAVGKWQCESVQ